MFLAFFKQWVQTDTVAKKFLLELNGFDFLLDRLFSKKDNKEEESKGIGFDEDEEEYDFEEFDD